MIFLLALVTSGLTSPIDKYEAKNAELRALLESGGPADITGSWTPKLTPEVEVIYGNICNNTTSLWLRLSCMCQHQANHEMLRSRS